MIRLAALAALAAAAALLPALDSTAAPTCTISWDRGANTDSWHDANNWSPNRVPAAADHVCLTGAAGPAVVFSSGSATIASIQDAGTDEPLRVTGGTLTVATPSGAETSAIDRLELEPGGRLDVNRAGGGEGATIQTLFQTGGVIGGTATVKTASFTWRAGSQDTPPSGPNNNLVGTGVTEVTGTLSIEDQSPTWTPGLGNDTKHLHRELRIASTATAELKGRNNAVLSVTGLSAKVANHGTLTIRDDQSIVGGRCCVNPSGGGALVSTGTIVKATGTNPNDGSTTGTGESGLDIPVDLDGVVSVSAGTLRVNGNGLTPHTADFRVADAATLRWSGGTHTVASAQGIHRSGTGGTARGTFSGGTVTIDAPYAMQGTTIDGGTVHFNQATAPGPLTLSSGHAHLNGAATTTTLTQTGGTLDGTAHLTFTTMTWRGGHQTTPPSGPNGNLVGTGVTEVTGTLSIEDSSPTWDPGNGNDTKTVSRELRIAGTAAAELKGRNSATLSLTGLSARLTNHGTLTIRDDQTIQSNRCCVSPAGPGAFVNTGTLIKAAGTNPNNGTPTGGGDSALETPLDLDGIVRVDSGTLRIDGTGLNSHAADFRVGAGDALRWHGGTHTVTGAQGIHRDGASGTARGFFTGGTVTLNAPYALQETAINGGTVTFAHASTTTGPLTLQDGRGNFDVAVTAPSLLQTGGTLGGTGALSAGTLTWRGGHQDTPPSGPHNDQPGTGVTTVTGTLAIEDTSPTRDPAVANADKTLSRELRLAAGATGKLEGRAGGPLALTGLSAKVTNQGTLTIREGQDVTSGRCCVHPTGPGAFVNTGTLITDGGAGETVVSAPNDLDGTVVVDSGALRIDGGGLSPHLADFQVADGATLRWHGGTHTVDGTQGIRRKGTTGTANGRFTGATVTIDAPYTLQDNALSDGRVNFTDPQTFGSLLQTGGTLGGTEVVSIGTLTWRGGTQDTPPSGPNNDQRGTGVTHVTGSASIEDASPTWDPNVTNGNKVLERELRIASGATGVLKGRTNGQLALTGLSARLTNHGTLTIRDDQDVLSNTCCPTPRGAGELINTGTLVKATGTNPSTGAQTGTGETIIDAPSDLDGTVDVDAGTLRIDGAGLATHAGDFRVADGTTLQWHGGTHTLASPQGIHRKGSSGTATGLFSGATITVDAPYTLQSTTLSAGRLNFTEPQTIGQLLQTGGTLGGTDLVNLGTLTWRGGTQDTPASGPNNDQPGTGITNVTGTLSIEDTSPTANPAVANEAKNLQRELRVPAGATGELKGRNGNDNAGRLNLSGISAKLANHGTFTIRDDQDISGSGSVVNTGTLVKAGGAAESIVDPSSDLDGTVDVDAGTLRIDGGGLNAHAGDFRVADGATLRWHGGTHTLDSAPGIHRKGAAGTASTTVSGGTLNLDAPLTTQSNTLSDGRLNVTDPLTVPHLLQTGGTLGGTELLRLGTFVWRAGSQDTPPTGPNNNLPGTGITEVTGTLSIEDTSPTANPAVANATKVLSRELRLLADATGELRGRNGNGDAGRLNVSGLSAKLVNHGTLTIRDDQDVLGGGCCVNPGGSGSFVNTGTVVKSGGTGQTHLHVTLDQQGTLTVDTGRVLLETLSNYNASTDTLGGGTYVVRGTLALAQGPVQTVSGHLTLDGAAAQVDNAATTAADDGLTTFNAVASGGRLSLVNSRALTAPAAGGPFTNSGTVTVGSGSTLTASGGFVNAASGMLTGTGTVAPSVQNAGTVEPGTSPGILSVAGNYTQLASGTLRTEVDGAGAGTGFDRLAVSGTATLAGTLDIPGTAAPAVGATFRIVTCATCTGSFGTVTGDVIDAERTYQVVRAADGVDLVVARRAEPAIAVPDSASVTEGDSSTKTLTLNATLAHATARTVTVAWATADQTAQQPGDYEQGSGTLTFAPGETTKPIVVTVKGDPRDEPDETLTVNLSNAVNGTLAPGDAQTVVTVADDDATPSLAAGEDQFVEEPDAGDADAVASVPVRLSAASGRTVTVAYATANGTATQPADYDTAAGTLTFAPGEVEKQVPVAVNGDDADEPAETLTLALSAPAGAGLAQRAASTVRIVDNDAPGEGPGPTPQVAIDDVAVGEGDGTGVEARFVVSLSEPTTHPVTVEYATQDGSAAAPGDYAARSGRLTFAPGQTVRAVAVPVVGDDEDEDDEAFAAVLSAPDGATLGTARGTATIADDDAPPRVETKVETKTETKVETKTVEKPAPPVQQLVARSGDPQYIGCVRTSEELSYRFVFPVIRVVNGKKVARKARVVRVRVLFAGRQLAEQKRPPFVARVSLAGVKPGLHELVANAVLRTPGSKRTTTKQFRYLFQVCP